MIDFVIPCHPKDFPSLKLSIDGIVRNLTCCNKIFVVSKEDPKIDNIIHVSEERYAPYVTKEKIEGIWRTKNPNLSYRSKWLYQQFLKLLFVRVAEVSSSSFVVVDADTIFLKDIPFNPLKFYYNRAEEYHLPYTKPISILLGIKNTIGFSTIAHHCIFNVKMINEMINNIENNFKRSFVDSILYSIDYNEASCFSEWDLYANYMLTNHPDVCECRQLVWKDISFVPTQIQLDQFKETFDFVSCHAYRRGIE